MPSGSALRTLESLCPAGYWLDRKAVLLPILLDVIAESADEPRGLDTLLPNGESIRRWIVTAGMDGHIFRPAPWPRFAVHPGGRNGA